MRFEKYLSEDIIAKALSIAEPKPGDEKSTENEVRRKIAILNKAISKQAKIVDGLDDGEQYDAALAVLRDLKDKLDKWSNDEEEIKSKGPNPPPGGEEPVPEEEEEEEEEEE